MTKTPIRALFIPLCDHYAAAIVVPERYGASMKACDYSVEMMKSWASLRGKFQAGQADVAFIVSPLAMDMFAEKPDFRCISLLHRDGNALAVNELLERKLHLAEKREDRKPTAEVAEALAAVKKDSGQAVVCGVPTPLSTHAVVLYKFLKDHGKSMGVETGDADVLIKSVPPSKACEFIQQEAKGGRAAAFEQSLPWADVVESGNYGKIAWYSRDVLPTAHGHVECIMIASDLAIRTKRAALQELVTAIHKAGRDIDQARKEGGAALEAIATMVHAKIPEHSVQAVVQSLRGDLNAINYSHLNVDKAGIKQIMDLAVEGKILKQAIDLDAFTDASFAVDEDKLR